MKTYGKTVKRGESKNWTLKTLKNMIINKELNLLNVQCYITQNKILHKELNEFSKTLECIDITKTMQVFWHYFHGTNRPPIGSHGRFCGFRGLNKGYDETINPLDYSNPDNIKNFLENIKLFLSPYESARFNCSKSSKLYRFILEATKFLPQNVPTSTRLQYIDLNLREPKYCITCGKLLLNPYYGGLKFCIASNKTNGRRIGNNRNCEKYYIDINKNIREQLLKVQYKKMAVKLNVGLYDIINEYCDSIDKEYFKNASVTCKLFHYLNEDNEIRKCANCGKTIPSKKFYDAYNKYPECCSYECSQKYAPNVEKRLINNSENCLGTNTNIGFHEKELVKWFSKKIGFEFKTGKHISKYFPDGLYKNIVLEINERFHASPKRIKHDIEKYDFLIKNGYKIIIIWEKLHKSKYHVIDMYKEMFGNNIIHYIIHDLSILTDEGWCEFDGIINNGKRNDLVKINNSLTCTSDHKIFTVDGKFEAKDCDGKFTYSYNGTNKMSVIPLQNQTEIVYDLLNVKNSKHSFFVNEGKFLVSNCYLLLIDEAHFISRNIAGELFASVWPTLSRSETSKCVMVSTANGVGGLFYDIWQDATIGGNKKWHPVLINWWDIEGRDEKWKQEQIRGFGPGGELKFAQEFGNEFLGSSPTLLDNSALKALTDLMLESKIEPKTWRIGNLKLGEFEVFIYKEPQKTHSYVLGGDVSEGIGMDYSIAKVFDITDPFNVEEVASFESNLVSGTLFGYIMAKMGRKYNDAYVACERNGVSATAIDALWRTFEYENVIDIGSNKYAVGIFSNHSVKLDACLHFRNLVNDPDFNLILQDGKTILELQRFEKLKAKSVTTYEASTGHDDRVMALIWAIYILKQEYLENYYNVSSYKVNAFGIEVPARLSFDLSMRTDGYFTSEEEFEVRREELEKIADKKLKLLESGKSEKEISETEETSLDYDFVLNSNDIEDDDHSF